ncbi:protein SMALL AUXIN UP-REGULATED RNA 51-like [Mercurialis annua]|uniref:protein SMALL AUXIN UP-REGULATED RNA 51-like n=1 Tax=Mercurialis annua TaxID=3986 RepID=UPI00215EB9C8|nr:protein SMALL AUXIN UP-REGULATED RNA 51-like [Mercurialis annua]
MPTSKLNALSQITMLKQIMKHWRSVGLKRRSQSNSDHNGVFSSSTVPSGFLAIYAGENRVRFLVPVRFLHFPIFIALLNKAEEEYGFKFNGGIVLPCEVEFFEQVLSFLRKDEKKYGGLEVGEFLKVISELDFGSSSSCKIQQGNCSSARDRLLPRMHRARV